MTARIARARCSCENTLWLCDDCMEVVRSQGVADMSPPPRNWRFLMVAAVVILGCSIAMNFVGGEW